MPDSIQQFGLRVIKGQEGSAFASITRVALAIAEPFYAAGMAIRNACYDRGIFKTRELGRPTISVGNITTGGTGKTPVVKWLAEEMRRSGHRPAILLRGYASASAGGSDEGQLLDQSLNADQPVKIPVQVNPSRLLGAAEVLRNHPEVTHFILDDGFQHRRAKRDFNLVLISATEPFGLGHVLPRGLLREPLLGLKRADAFLITRCSLVDEAQIWEIDRYLKYNHPAIPIFHADHHLAELWMPITGDRFPMQSLAGKSIFLTAGIGDPAAFERQIAEMGCKIVGVKWFADHHAFTAAEVKSVADQANAAGADLLLTTEKDWVKIGPAISADVSAFPVAVARLDIHFHGDDAGKLIALAAS